MLHVAGGPETSLQGGVYGHVEVETVDRPREMDGS